MSYVRRARQPALGWVQAIPVVISTAQQLSTLFGSGGVSLGDKIVQRIAWTLQAAQMGSALAAAIILGGSHEGTVNSQERAGWSAVLSQVPDDVIARARAAYPNGFWPVGQPDFLTDTGGVTHTTIVREVNQAANESPETYTGAPVPGSTGGSSFPTSPTYQPTTTRPSTTSPTGYQLPPVRTTAAYNWTPLIAFGAGAAALLFLNRPRRRR